MMFKKVRMVGNSRSTRLAAESDIRLRFYSISGGGSKDGSAGSVEIYGENGRLRSDITWIGPNLSNIKAGHPCDSLFEFAYETLSEGIIWRRGS